MKALSVCQPWAERIASGAKRFECRPWQAPSIVGHDLLIVASKRTWEGYAGEPRGVAICVVRVVAMRGEPKAYEWVFTDPRRVRMHAITGRLGLFVVDDDRIEILPGVAAKRAAR